MTDTHGNTPGTGPVPPTQGEEHAQHAAPTGQQPYYQQQQYYQQPQHPQHPAGSVNVERKSHGGRTFLLAFCGAAVACAIGLGGFGIWQASTGGSSSSDGGSSTQLGSQNSGSINATDAESDQTLAEAVAQKALPSVAAIDVYANQSSSGSMFGNGTNSGSDSGTLTEASLGSGVVLTADGYIITNYHVIAGGDAYKVTIEGETYDAEVVGSDPSSDIAVIKAKDASGLTPVEIGDSDDLIIGEWVMTIGSPFGLEQSVATGIVSATSRSQIMDASTDQYGQSSGETTIYPNMIQTDAAINPGNSGGALLNSKGEVIGINEAKYADEKVEGVGYAIPISHAKDIIDDLKTRTTKVEVGEEEQGYLGIQIQNIDTSMAKLYGMPEGVYVYKITEDSAAANSELKEKDIITKFDGETVRNYADLTKLLTYYKEGTTVNLTVQRLENGEYVEKEIPITLNARPQEEETAEQPE